MTEDFRFATLRIVLPAEDGETSMVWHAFASDGGWAAHGESAVAAMPAADVLEVVLPSRRIALHRLMLPPNAGRHLDAVMAQALEDRLLGHKADALAIPADPASQDGMERHVWVCSRRWLEHGLGSLAAAGRRPARLIPEYGLLPEASGATTCACVAGGVIFRTAERRFGIVANEAAVVTLAGDTPLVRVTDLGARQCPAARRLALPGTLARFAGLGFDPRAWRWPIVLAAVSAVLLLAGVLIHWQRLEGREARLRHEIRQTFAAAYPGTPIVDPVLQWESKQREASAGQSDALDAVFRLAMAVDAPIRPRRIESGDGFVRLTLTDSDAARFKAQLEAAGTPETTKAEDGLTRFSYRPARER